MRFENNVAIITGAASGIGLAIAKRLGSEGAKTVLADLNEQNLEAAVGDVLQAGAPEVLPVVCNVADEAQVANAVLTAINRFGVVNVIVNNAGLMSFKPLEQQTEDDWIKILKVDLL